MLYQEATSTQLNKIAHPKPPTVHLVDMWPLLGKHLHLALNQLAKKYGNIFQIRVGAKTLVVLNGLETIKEALVKQQDSFNARADFDIFQQPPQSQFLELKSGESWRKHHTILGKIIHTFVVNRSDVFESWAIEEAVDLTNIFLKFSGKPFDPDLYMPLATLSCMQRQIFGKRGNLDDPQEDMEFVSTAYTLKYIPTVLEAVRLEHIPKICQPIYRLSRWKSLRNFLKGLAALEKYVSKNVDQHRESLDPENLRDITDALFKASSELTESDRNDLRLNENDIVNGSLMQLAGAGAGLASFMLRWGVLYMITHPAIQTAIHRELDEVVGREQQPSLEHRGKLPLMEACINEIFRHSSITTLPPITYATTTDVVLEGCFIPQNTPLLVNYYGLTRDERYWEEPEQFNPYRFLDENGKLRKNLLDKFYPFGIGSRRCIGEYIGRLLIFTFFTNLMHKCKFEKV
ncbi:cytochrome P450, partial [Pelatocladus sp. BLCC-F211]|uniref:cytochrome P450 n=1 Tax=Pelatocladus sp. BLCC-F211 TaxID=3342752 RepID=UPI0035B7DC26